MGLNFGSGGVEATRTPNLGEAAKRTAGAAAKLAGRTAAGAVVAPFVGVGLAGRGAVEAVKFTGRAVQAGAEAVGAGARATQRGADTLYNATLDAAGEASKTAEAGVKRAQELGFSVINGKIIFGETRLIPVGERPPTPQGRLEARREEVAYINEQLRRVDNPAQAGFDRLTGMMLNVVGREQMRDVADRVRKGQATQEQANIELGQLMDRAEALAYAMERRILAEQGTPQSRIDRITAVTTGERGGNDVTGGRLTEGGDVRAERKMLRAVVNMELQMAKIRARAEAPLTGGALGKDLTGAGFLDMNAVAMRAALGLATMQPESFVPNLVDAQGREQVAGSVESSINARRDAAVQLLDSAFGAITDLIPGKRKAKSAAAPNPAAAAAAGAPIPPGGPTALRGVIDAVLGGVASADVGLGGVLESVQGLAATGLSGASRTADYAHKIFELTASLDPFGTGVAERTMNVLAAKFTGGRVQNAYALLDNLTQEVYAATYLGGEQDRAQLALMTMNRAVYDEKQRGLLRRFAVRTARHIWDTRLVPADFARRIGWTNRKRARVGINYRANSGLRVNAEQQLGVVANRTAPWEARAAAQDEFLAQYPHRADLANAAAGPDVNTLQYYRDQQELFGLDAQVRSLENALRTQPGGFAGRNAILLQRQLDAARANLEARDRAINPAFYADRDVIANPASDPATVTVAYQRAIAAYPQRQPELDALMRAATPAGGAPTNP